MVLNTTKDKSLWCYYIWYRAINHCFLLSNHHTRNADHTRNSVLKMYFNVKTKLLHKNELPNMRVWGIYINEIAGQQQKVWTILLKWFKREIHVWKIIGFTIVQVHGMLWALLIVEGFTMTYCSLNFCGIWSLVKSCLIGSHTTSSFLHVWNAICIIIYLLKIYCQISSSCGI